MSAGALRSLTIAHLRGAVAPFTLAFEPGKKLTVIYGENGAGKSSICDALDFIGAGAVGSLEGRGLGRTRTYWPSVGRAPADVAVTLETDDGVCRAVMGKAEVLALPAGCRPRVEVLRRAQILALLEATPSQRYEAVRRFIDVSAIERSEQALRQAVKDAAAGRDAAAARAAESLESIRQLWADAQTAEPDPLAWAAREAARELGAVRAELEALDAMCKAYDRVADAAGEVAAAEREAEHARAALVAAEGAAAAAAADSLGGPEEAAAVEVLEAAARHLERHPAAVACPLCDAPHSPGELGARVAGRLRALAALAAAHADVRARRESADRAARRLDEARAAAHRHAAELARCLTSRAWPAEIVVPASAVPADPAAWPAWLGATRELPDRWRAVGVARASGVRLRATLERALRAHDEGVRGERELGAVLPRLERALEIVAEERRRFTDHTLAAIATEVGRLYEAVHPGEGLDAVRLELDPKKRASLDIGSGFPGTGGAPPQAYYSDSHLDTLGLCMFIALAARDGPAETILVLDDVLGSVDRAHAERVVAMLADEGTRFRHCLVTTHVKPWSADDGWGDLTREVCQYVELGPWEPARGMVVAG